MTTQLHLAHSVHPADIELATQLVAANRILVDRAALDGFGHVSVRSAADPDTFLISRNLAPALAQLSDIQTFDLDCNTSDARPTYLEKYIHAEIYRSRPDVQAVVHGHSAAVLPFSVSDQTLRPVIHMSGFLYPYAPVFEIRADLGDTTDLLVRDATTGAALARALGTSSVVLMRGHGSATVGRSLPEAVFRAVYTEANAKAQLSAALLGVTMYLSEGEAHSSAETIAGQAGRAWDYWCGRIATAAE